MGLGCDQNRQTLKDCGLLWTFGLTLLAKEGLLLYSI